MPGNRNYCPRLSTAKDLLPLVRRQLLDAASKHPVPASLDLFPIVEDGLFGYEIIPDCDTHTYLIVGCDAEGRALVRKTSYEIDAPDSMHLATVNGRPLSRSQRAARFRVKPREYVFPDLFAAAQSAMMQLLVLLPERPAEAHTMHDAPEDLEGALAVAHAQLVAWDPLVRFAGLPGEAQMGFVLTGDRDQHGTLTRQQEGWVLDWVAPPTVIHRTWMPGAGATLGVQRAGVGERRAAERRRFLRRATDRGFLPAPWTCEDRRASPGRRQKDINAS